MSRKGRIIVSITGIFLVLLILTVFTYAYFLTKIKGNENDKSISVTMANLELIYSDGNGEIGTLNIEPGETITSKEFTVTNNGNATVNNYAVYLENLVNTFERNEDITYTLTCKSNITNKSCSGKSETIFPNENGILTINSIDVKETHTYSLTVMYKETNTDQSVDMNKTLSGKIQIYALEDIVDLTGNVVGYNEGDYIELHSNPKKSEIVNDKYVIPAVEPGIHTIYIKDKDGNNKGEKTITIEQKSTPIIEGSKIGVTKESHKVTVDIDISREELNVDIKMIEKYNPYDKYKDSLAYKIINNAQNGTSETSTKIGTEVSEFTSISGPNERVLNTTTDDYGTSYYFRGNVKDNYVAFADKTWRIIRINGDGSVRMILNSVAKDTSGNIIRTAFNSKADDNAYVGYMYGLAGTTTDKDRCLILVDDEVVDKVEEYSTKEICESANGTWTTTAYGATHANIKDSTIKTVLDKWYEDNLNNYTNYLSDTLFCNDKNLIKYSGFSKNLADYIQSDVIYSVKNATLKCSTNNSKSLSAFSVTKNGDIKPYTNGKLKYPIGLITASEVYLAGARGSNETYATNKNYYLINGYSYYYSMSPFVFRDAAKIGFPNGYTGINTPVSVNDSGGYLRPVINLKLEASVTGDGTKNSPYTLTA